MKRSQIDQFDLTNQMNLSTSDEIWIQNRLRRNATEVWNSTNIFWRLVDSIKISRNARENSKKRKIIIVF